MEKIKELFSMSGPVTADRASVGEPRLGNNATMQNTIKTNDYDEKHDCSRECGQRPHTIR